MRKQLLTSEILDNLNRLPMSAQYNNFVRIDNEQAKYFLRKKKNILVLNKNKTGWAENECELKTGKKFIYWG